MSYEPQQGQVAQPNVAPPDAGVTTTDPQSVATFNSTGPLPPVATGTPAQRPSASEIAYGAPIKPEQPATNCVAIFRWMLLHQTATPEAVAKLIHQYPEQRDAVLSAAKEAAKTEVDLPENFVTQVQSVEATLPPVTAPHATDNSAKPGSPFGTSAPSANVKNPADGVGAYSAYQGTNQQILDPTKTASPAIAQPDGSMKLDPVTTTTTASGTKTTTTVDKSIAQSDTKDAVDQANALRDYKAKVKAAISEQSSGLSSTNSKTDEEKKHREELVGKLQAAQDQADAAPDVAALDKIVAANKLLVIPPEALLNATVKTTSTTVSGAAVLDGGTMLGASTKKTTIDTQDPMNPGKNVQTTNSGSIGVGTKGIDGSLSTSTTKTDQDSGKQSTTGYKGSVSGGITDPLTASAKRTTDGGEIGVTAKAGEGQGTVAVGGKTTKDGLPQTSGSVQAGVTQGPTGTGVTAGVPDLRHDMGGKDTTAGVYGSADGSISVMVSGDETAGYTLTFTASSRIKAGLFAGKRQGEQPVEVGPDSGRSMGASAGHTHVVTRSKKMSKAEMDALIPELDKLASGRTPDGKKAYGSEAAYAAYTQVFHGHLDDLFGGEAKAAKGESISIADESSIGVDAKANKSDGESKTSRASVDVSGSAEVADISGVSESNDNGFITRSILTGHRDKGSVSAGAGFGAASMKAGVSGSQENTTTFVFRVPEGNATLLAQVRAIKNEEQAKAFAQNHPETKAGKVDGDVKTTGNNVGANVGPIGANIGTTSTVDQNITSSTHKGADGKDVKDLSGTIGGKQEGTADVSLLGVKGYQEKTTAESKGTVDTNGQASLDVTTTTSASNAKDNYAKNKADLDATSTKDKELIVATGGPMGYVKKLAERVGEQNTIGAHFDHASFETVVALAGDHNRWMKAADSYREEWNHLGNTLVKPAPPPSWLAQDESEGKVAAYQLARMKAFADYMAAAGYKGTETVQRLRSQFNGDNMNVLGATMSWPPSLQSKRVDFDSLASKVEHLTPSMKPYAHGGDTAGGDAFLEKLDKDLEALKVAIANAPDHENQTKAVQAANGVGQMQEKVRAMKERFHAALDIQSKKGTNAQIDAAFDDPKKASKELYDAQQKMKEDIAKRDQAAAHQALPAKGDEKAWEAHDKAVVNQGGSQEEREKLDAMRAQENKAREDEAVKDARLKIETHHEACIHSRDGLFGLTARAKAALPSGTFAFMGDAKDAMKLVDQVRPTIEQWQTAWKAYKDACEKTGTFPDMTVEPKLQEAMKGNLVAVREAATSDWDKNAITKLLKDWG